jgi:hypothetical protein
MKTTLAKAATVFAVAFLLSGCGMLKHSAPSASAATPPTVTTSKTVPATSAAASSPVAAAVSKIVYLVYAAGICCLVAGGLLLYVGQVIPGAKCLVAGIVLPVGATWFNYHYAVVLAGLFVASAIGFLWAFAKNNPATVGIIEKFFVNGYGKTVSELKTAATAVSAKL